MASAGGWRVAPAVADGERPRRGGGERDKRWADRRARPGGPPHKGKWPPRPRRDEEPRGDRPYQEHGRQSERRPDDRRPDEGRADGKHRRAEDPGDQAGAGRQTGPRSGGEPWHAGRAQRRREPSGERRPFTRRSSGRGPGPWPHPHAPARPERGDLIAEGEELIAGRRPVEEAYVAGRHVHRLLVVPERRAALDSLVVHATTLRLPVVEVEGGTLTMLAGFDGHQGVALVVEPRRSATLDDILALARQRAEAPLVMALDGLEDPQNFGTLLRSAEACGVHGVLFPTRRAAPLSPAAIKAAAGATEHLLLAPVDNLPGALADLHSHGVRVVAAEEGAALDYLEADLRGPLAIVVGSEGRGISGPVRRRLDLSVRIPMRGRVASLNAAVAGSVLLFAASAQRPAAPGEAVVDGEPRARS